MSAGARIRTLALSLLLPLLHVVLVVFFIVATMDLGSNDRAIVWVEGSEGQLAQLSRLVADNGQFRAGRAGEPGMQGPPPESCNAGSRPFSFSSLRGEESHAARQLLETLAREAGARVCLTNYYILNELPDASTGTNTTQVVHLLLQTQLLPGGVVLAIFVAFAAQLRLLPTPTLPAWQRVALGAGVAMLAWTAAATFAWIGNAEADSPSLSLAGVGMGLGFAILIVEPCMEELAFRAWMLPLAERAVGTRPAVIVTTALYVALQLPSSLESLLGELVLGSALALLYLRTRSLLACIVANGLVGATAFIVG